MILKGLEIAGGKWSWVGHFVRISTALLRAVQLATQMTQMTFMILENWREMLAGDLCSRYS